MKKFFSIFLLCLSALCVCAQSNNNEEEVVKIERFNQRAFRPDEVIVKFKEDGAVRMRAPQRAKFASSQVSAVDQLFLTLGVDSVEELMPMTGSKVLPKRIKAYNGQDIEPKSLGKLYRLKISSQAMQWRSVYEVIDTLKTLAEVDYAEPNYIVYALSSGESDSATYCREPLYSQQWGLSAIRMPYLWNQTKVRTKRPVIAILDTGVDIEHPDLADNIWTNAGEADGADGQDDDNNGFTDDLHGWDFVNQRGQIADYNGHGTHCAGIAAAVGDNGIGITGANPDALIMPVAVLQADGSGDVATIIKGIDYAAANGADVISMSFGGYGYSVAQEQALGRAYATSVLVAAAGNDGLFLDTGTQTCYPKIKTKGPNLMYPACFTFVLGVEAGEPGGCDAIFSNIDGVTGPIYSTYDEERLYNYELRAPGTNILSTFPGGRYKSLNGTSMACPLVAGAISRLLQAKTDSALVSKEVLFGDLIHSRPDLSGNINMQTVYNYSDANRRPTLWLVGQQIKDTIVGDGDGEYDAGEIVAFYPILRNDWGMAKNIRFWMRTGHYMDDDWVTGDTAQIHYLTDTVSFGKPLSSYAKNTSVNPICFSIDPDCNDGVKIPLTFFAVCEGIQDTLRQTITIQVTNGVEIGGVITEDMTLYPNVHYIVTRQLAVPEGVTLTLKPGTVLKFKDGTGMANAGKVIANGKPDSMIVFTKADLSYGRISSTFQDIDSISYCIFEELDFGSKDLLRGSVENGKNGVHNSIFRYNIANHILNAFEDYYYSSRRFNNLSIYDNDANPIYVGAVANSNIIHNREGFYDPNLAIESNNVYGNNGHDFGTVHTDKVFVHNSAQYWGSNREDIIRKSIWDMNHTGTSNFCHYDLSTRLTRPNPLAHGIVWKVIINGYDAQDEFEQLPPLGVGTHKCEVYFNRGMDTLITPYISYGVRPPYTQHAINTNGSWSADSTVYTAYFTIDAKTVSDGLNRIYVADAQDDEHFEIPIENMRFNMQIGAAGSLSTGLMAEAGLGKVTLTWETDEADYEDLLGYNIYRWTEDTIRWDRYWDDDCSCWREAGWRIDTVQINRTLINSEEEAYVDYDVVPGKSYYYILKQITTSLSQYDLSNPVTATPLTAQKGDANGSMSVDVADVVTEISHLTGGNPQPFIFEAADVNSDGVVNILDIVGTINIITHPDASALGFSAENTATYTVEDGILYVETPVVLGGVQLTLQATKGSVFTVLDALKPFEQVGQWTGEESYLFMAYSMSNKTLGIGKHALMRIGDAAVEDIILSTPQGQNVPAISGQVSTISTAESMQMRLPAPNPFCDAVAIPFVVGKTGTHSVQLRFSNVAGLTVDTYTATLPFGEYTYTWHAASLPAGVYFVTLYVDDRKIQNNKLIHIQ